MHYKKEWALKGTQQLLQSNVTICIYEIIYVYHKFPDLTPKYHNYLCICSLISKYVSYVVVEVEARLQHLQCMNDALPI